MLAEIASPEVGASASFAAMPGVASAAAGQEVEFFWPQPHGVLQVVSVPIWIDPGQPEILGTLSVGVSASTPGRRRASRRSPTATSPSASTARSRPRRCRRHPGRSSRRCWRATARGERVAVGGQEYIAKTRALSVAAPDAAPAARPRPPAARLRPGHHPALAHRAPALPERRCTAASRVTAVVAVLAATLLSYAIARTVTRPLGAITATMREMAATGDLTRRIPLPAGARWEDEDARLLATTFNSMTDSIGRFQREAAQRERLSSLGRLSTVVAHEIRNPLMIIKTALRRCGRRT